MGSESPVFLLRGVSAFQAASGGAPRAPRGDPRRAESGTTSPVMPPGAAAISAPTAGPGRAGPASPHSPLCSSGLAAFPAPRHELGRRRRGSQAPPGPVSVALTASGLAALRWGRAGGGEGDRARQAFGGDGGAGAVSVGAGRARQRSRAAGEVAGFVRGAPLGGVTAQLTGSDRSDEVWQGGNRMILDRSGCGGAAEDLWLHLAPENPVSGGLF